MTARRGPWLSGLIVAVLGAAVMIGLMLCGVVGLVEGLPEVLAM
jgi:hypothetical protein